MIGWATLMPSTRLVIKLVALLLLLGVVLYVVTALDTSQADAFDIVTGTASPYALRAGFAGVLLAVAGYLFAPAIVGVVLAAVLDKKSQRDVAPRLDDVTPKIEEEVKRQLLELQGTPSGPQLTEPDSPTPTAGFNSPPVNPTGG